MDRKTLIQHIEKDIAWEKQLAQVSLEASPAVSSGHSAAAEQATKDLRRVRQLGPGLDEFLEWFEDRSGKDFAGTLLAAVIRQFMEQHAGGIAPDGDPRSASTP